MFAGGTPVPADTKKDGTAFDLPIALGLLIATGQLRNGSTDGLVALGELGLDGSLRPVRGVLPVARLLARSVTAQALVFPPTNIPEASLVSALRLSTSPTLAELVDGLRRDDLPRATAPACLTSEPDDGADMADVAGQPMAKRALEIAAPAAMLCSWCGRQDPGPFSRSLAWRHPPTGGELVPAPNV